MATVRKTGTGFELIDLTTEILEMDNQYGLLNDMGLFSGEGVETDSVTFDKEDTQIVLMNQTNRGGKPVYGKDRNRTLHALPIPYYKRVDTVTVKDIRGQRRLGSEDMEDVANAVAKKLTDMRMAADQTIEWQKLHALKGITLDSQGNTIANMFTEFGITQDSVDFVLGTAGTDVPAQPGGGDNEDFFWLWCCVHKKQFLIITSISSSLRAFPRHCKYFLVIASISRHCERSEAISSINGSKRCSALRCVCTT